MHDHFEILETDENFETGTLRHLVAGNEGRVLDGRRTPGYIESYDADSAMFVWRITAFEDRGKCWEIPAEDISTYQFRKTSTLLSQREADSISVRCAALQEPLQIVAEKSHYAESMRWIGEQEKIAEEWLRHHSAFLKCGKKLDFSAETGDQDLFSDFARYMEEMGVLELEQRTADQYVLNPYSGEWIKGMKIVMAQMGLMDYRGTVLRKKDTFAGIGCVELRKRYIVARIAFLRGLFRIFDCREVPLFRGVASGVDFFKTPKGLLSTTFSSSTAKSFAGMEDETAPRSCYWVKFACPVEDLFMTYLETEAFNSRYQEQEAVIFYKNQFGF